jgi:hypothetical protein
MAKEEKMGIIFWLIADSLVFVNIRREASSTLSSWYGLTKKAPGKGFEERGNYFGFPDFVQYGMGMRRNGSGTCRGERMFLLLLEMVVCSFGGAFTISGRSPSKNVWLSGRHNLNRIDSLDRWGCKSSVYNMMIPIMRILHPQIRNKGR